MRYVADFGPGDEASCRFSSRLAGATRQFLRRQTKRLFDEDMAVCREGRLNQWGVQMISRGDQYRRGHFIGENLTRISRRRLKPEFRFDMIRAQGRLIDHC